MKCRSAPGPGDRQLISRTASPGRLLYADRRTVSVAFVFSVLAMLSLSTSTSQWRIAALPTVVGGTPASGAAMGQLANELVGFCEAGMGAPLDG